MSPLTQDKKIPETLLILCNPLYKKLYYILVKLLLNLNLLNACEKLFGERPTGTELRSLSLEKSILAPFLLAFHQGAFHKQFKLH
jgi:hypothetical protein